MAYKYISKSKAKKYVKKSRKVIKHVQENLSNISFEAKLVGSNKYSLVTTNSNTGCFDVDFTLIITKYDNCDAKFIKNKIMSSFQECYEKFGFNGFKEGSRSMKLMFSENNQLKYYTEIAIYKYDEEGYPCILKFDKKSQKMIWNREDIDIELLDKQIYSIKKCGYWNKFRDKYLDKKNYYLKNNEHRKSFSIYKETANEIIQEIENNN